MRKKNINEKRTSDKLSQRKRNKYVVFLQDNNREPPEQQMRNEWTSVAIISNHFNPDVAIKKINAITEMCNRNKSLGLQKLLIMS